MQHELPEILQLGDQIMPEELHLRASCMSSSPAVWLQRLRHIPWRISLDEKSCPSHGSSPLSWVLLSYDEHDFQ